VSASFLRGADRQSGTINRPVQSAAILSAGVYVTYMWIHINDNGSAMVMMSDVRDYAYNDDPDDIDTVGV
jgi:hypothetical protein